MKDTKNAKPKSFFARTVAAMLLAAALGALAAFGVIARLEKGVLEVYGVQQDAYVQLVLDQIALHEGQSDDAIIEDILGTLDASTNKYWVFSRGETMLFVKDVMETNKYKGFTAASYYNSPSASAFLSTLRQGLVQHAKITIGQSEYMASGALFLHGGAEYRLCLLTDTDMVLENNAYLRVRSELWALVLALLAALCVLPPLAAWKLDKARAQNGQNGQTIRTLRAALAEMNDRYINRDWLWPECRLWQAEALPVFAGQLAKKEFSSAVFARCRFSGPAEQWQFLRKARLCLPPSVLRFANGKNELVLLFVNRDIRQAQGSLAGLLPETVQCICTEARTPQQLLEEQARIHAQQEDQTWQ